MKICQRKEERINARRTITIIQLIVNSWSLRPLIPQFDSIIEPLIEYIDTQNWTLLCKTSLVKLTSISGTANYYRRFLNNGNSRT